MAAIEQHIPANAQDEGVEPVDDLLFGVRRSARYHSARRRFFHAWSRLLSFLSVLAGAGAVASLLAAAPGWVPMAVAGLVAVAQAAELVFDLSGKAMRHEGLYRDFVALEARIVSALGEPGGVDARRLADLNTERLRIEVGEPPVLRWLDVLCHNELAGAMGRRDSVHRVGWLQRQLAQYVDLGPVHSTKGDAA